MNEKQKLTEAKYFYARMEETKLSRDDFSNNLSAFLSSSRTVFQYALKEAKSKSDGLSWYNNKISSSPVIQYFKDKRNVNIHEKPIETKAHYSIETTLTLSLSGSATVKDQDGNIISHTEFGNPSPKTSDNKTKMDVEYFFDDWSGGENVLVLCLLYIGKIEAFINEGLSLNHISG